MHATEVLTPAQILALEPEGADRLLDALERTVPMRPPLLPIPSRPDAELLVFGDTHGDWRSTRAAVEMASAPGTERWLLGLGDYVDRAPDDLPNGSVANTLHLLSLTARYPERVYLLQGNHETSRRIPCYPHTLPEEVDDLWGPEAERYHRLVGLLERGAYAAVTESGAYLAHAGFPRTLPSGSWRSAFEAMDDDRLSEVVWAECDASRIRRGAAPSWGARALSEFLAATGLGIVLRGHDPDVVGRPLYDGRCLTLHTTRIYERYGGVIVAVVPLGGRLESVKDLRIEHLPTEGRSYPDDQD